MKKKDIFLLLGLIVVVILVFFVMNTRSAKNVINYELPLTLAGENGLHLLSYSEYQKKIDNDESFVVILSRESCSHCANFLPVAKEFAEENQYPMYYIDTDTFSSEDWNNFQNSNSFLKKNRDNWGTPTTVVLAGYDAVDYIEGETTKEELQKLYEKSFDLNKE